MGINLRFFVFSFLLFWLSACSPSNQFPDAIYLDYAASWQIDDASLNKFIEVSRLLGNSSGINSHSEHLKQLERVAAETVANKLHAKRDQIHFVSGASIANNIAILGVARKHPKCHLITSKIEHKSVLDIFKRLEKEGYEVTYLNTDRYGVVDLHQLKKSIKRNTKLISIQMVNSEIGILQNVKKIGKIARARGVLFHSDASQAFCKHEIDVDEMKVDLLTVSGYKVGAPKGIAALYARDADELQPIMFGSGDKLFPGTKSTALICAFAKAVEDFSFDAKRVSENYAAFVREISKIKGIYINSSEPSHIVSVSIAGVLLSDILERTKQFSFSAGCSCLGRDKSNVIEAIDPDGRLPACTIRISFSDKTSADRLTNFAKELKAVIERLRKEKNVAKGCESTFSETSQETLNKKLDDIGKLLGR